MKDIAGFEGLYAITSCGKVWSYKSKKFLNPRNGGKGYKQVMLYKDGKGKNYYVHRLVAEAYIPNPNNLPQINHKDEDKSHNYLNNLEWITHKDNQNYGTHNRRMGLSHAKPVYCIELDRVFESQVQACRELNINPGQLSQLLRGKGRYKTAGGYHWIYS